VKKIYLYIVLLLVLMLYSCAKINKVALTPLSTSAASVNVSPSPSPSEKADVNPKTALTDNPIDNFYNSIAFTCMASLRGKREEQAKAWQAEVENAYEKHCQFADFKKAKDDFVKFAEADSNLGGFVYFSNAFLKDVLVGKEDASAGNGIGEGFSDARIYLYRNKAIELYNILEKSRVQCEYVFDSQKSEFKDSEKTLNPDNPSDKIIWKSYDDVNKYFIQNPIDKYFNRKYKECKNKDEFKQYAIWQAVSWEQEMNNAYRALYDSAFDYLNVKENILDSQKYF